VEIQQAFSGVGTSELFICKICHHSLLMNKLPVQAAINGLTLDPIPQELQLTELESVLVGQRIFFMQLLALPRGRQRGIHGAVVNVPSSVSTAVTSLPLTPHKAGLVPLKLKHKLEYKGYVLNQFVRPAAVIEAARWLIKHNPLYSNIIVDDNWCQLCADEDVDVWDSMCKTSETLMTDDAQTKKDNESDVEPDSDGNSSEKLAGDDSIEDDSDSHLRLDESICKTSEIVVTRATETEKNNESDVEPDSDGDDSDKETGDDTIDDDSESDSRLDEKLRGLKHSTCMEPRDPQYAATELSVAPAQGQTPLDLMMDDNAEVLAFACKYPLGHGGLTDRRRLAITPKNTSFNAY